MTSPIHQSLMHFPCDFSIKIIGKNSASFEADVLSIAQKHYPNVADGDIRSQLSQQGKYRSFNITVHATDQTTLDALYQELTKHPDANMVL